MRILAFIDVLQTIGTYALYILLFAVVLGVIVGIHEFGHFIFAKRGGILCREYAIGMGPLLWKKKKGETQYSLRAIPLGGFCAIAGEEVEADPFKDKEYIKLDIKDNVIKGFYLEDENPKIDYPRYKIVSYDIYDEAQTGKLFMTVLNDQQDEITFDVDPQAMLYYKKDEMQIAPYNRTLGSKSLGRRAMVMFGGPMMNFVLALVVFFIVGLCMGFEDYKSNEIGKINENTYNYSLGIRTDDRIIALETATLGKVAISDWQDIDEFLKKYSDGLYLNEYINVTLENEDGNTKEAKVTPYVVIYNGGFSSDRKYLETNKVVVGVVDGLSDGLGDNSQLQAGDQIIEINGKKVTSWKDVAVVFKDYDKDESIALKVLRKNKDNEEISEIDITVTPYSKKIMDSQTSLLGEGISTVSIEFGISPAKKFNLFKSFGYSFTRTWQSATAVFDTLGMLFSRTVSIKNLSGPIGIFSMTSEVAKYGITYILSLIGLLSVNIGLMNLFPIPALDGGRLVFLGYEAITRKKPNPKVETALITITMILLLALMAFASYSDIVRIIKG